MMARQHLADKQDCLTFLTGDMSHLNLLAGSFGAADHRTSAARKSAFDPSCPVVDGQVPGAHQLATSPMPRGAPVALEPCLRQYRYEVGSFRGIPVKRPPGGPKVPCKGPEWHLIRYH